MDDSVHIFWHNQQKIKAAESWPNDRTWVAGTGRSTTAVFVVYQSKAAPHPELGRLGDVWVTPDDAYYNTAEGWTLWSNGAVIPCPYNDKLRLMWSAHAQFKYLSTSSRDTESGRWKQG